MAATSGGRNGGFWELPAKQWGVGLNCGVKDTAVDQKKGPTRDTFTDSKNQGVGWCVGGVIQFCEAGSDVIRGNKKGACPDMIIRGQP